MLLNTNEQILQDSQALSHNLQAKNTKEQAWDLFQMLNGRILLPIKNDGF
jgi:hypothetical protein